MEKNEEHTDNYTAYTSSGKIEKYKEELERNRLEREAIERIKSSTPKSVNLQFAIMRFIANCQEVKQSAVNPMFKQRGNAKSEGKYSTLSDVNRVIREASEKTYKEFDGQIAVSVLTNSITPIKNIGKYSIKIEVSIVATRLYCNSLDIQTQSRSMTIEYADCFSPTEKIGSMNACQSFASAITYIEKKAKKCICHLIDESEEDLDSPEFMSSKKETISGKIEGLNV